MQAKARPFLRLRLSPAPASQQRPSRYGTGVRPLIRSAPEQRGLGLEPLEPQRVCAANNEGRV